MTIAKQLIKLRLGALIKKDNLPELFLLAIIAGVYFYMGRQVALLLNGFGTGVPVKMVNYIYIALLGSPLLATFMPSFSIKSAFLPSYLPLKTNFFFFTDLLMALGRRPAIAGFSSLLGLVLFYSSGSLWFFFTGLFCVGNAFLLSEYITNVVTWKKYPLLLPLPAILILFYYMFSTGLFSAGITLAINVAISVVLVALCRFSFSVQPPPSSAVLQVSQLFRSKKAALYKEVLQNNTAVTVLVVAFIAKVIVLFFIPLKVDLAYNSLAQNPIQLVFFTPIFIFGYVFNNTFGFFRSLFLSTWMYNNSTARHTTIYAKLLCPFLFLDLAIAILFLTYHHALNVVLLSFYAIMCMYYIAVSLISSVAGVRTVDGYSANIFKKNTPTVASILLLAPVFGVVYYYKTLGMLLLPATAAVLVWISLMVLFNRYKESWTVTVIRQLK